MDNKKKARDLTIAIWLNYYSSDLSRLFKYSLFIQSELVDKIPDIWKKIIIKETSNQLPLIKELQKELNELIIEDGIERLPLTIWQSIFIHSYHLFENLLLKVCELMQKQNQYKISINDLSSRGIFKYRDYLKKVAELNFPDNSKEWQQILFYNKIRNIIVHNNAEVNENKINITLLDYISKTDNIEINEKKVLTFDVHFIQESIRNYISMIEKLKECICPIAKSIQEQYSEIIKLM